MHIGLVREAGGFGDIISVGGAATALKLEDPEVKITFFVPDEFVEVASHLAHIDEVVGLGPLKIVSKQRRSRDVPLEAANTEYLKVLEDYDCDKFVDLFCPAFLYESTERGTLRYTRSQLFAMAAGAQSIEKAFPEWVVSEAEESSGLLYTLGMDLSKPTVAVAFRTTCSTRTYPKEHAEVLLNRLIGTGLNVIYFEGAGLHFLIPKGVVVCRHQPFPVFAAAVNLCDFVLTADTCLLHLGQALKKPTLVIYGNKDSYPFDKWCDNIYTVNGVSDKCGRPCNYAAVKGWDKMKCRPAGCPRMESNTPDRVADALSVAMEKEGLL